jgi:hypothetical protein
MARLTLRRYRCWWQPPFGHVDELIDYVDALSGRWTARIRCTRCGREAGLTVGHAAGALRVHPKNPLTILLPRQGGKPLPSRKRVALEPSAAGRGALELALPDGNQVHVRAVQARLSLGRRRVMYLAGTKDAPPHVSSDLRSALARACAGVDETWLEGTARQLEAELPAGS